MGWNDHEDPDRCQQDFDRQQEAWDEDLVVYLRDKQPAYWVREAEERDRSQRRHFQLLALRRRIVERLARRQLWMTWSARSVTDSSSWSYHRAWRILRRLAKRGYGPEDDGCVPCTRSFL